MKTEISEVSQTRKEIKIEIEAERLLSAYDQISDRYAKMANVPGFRRGNAPRSVVRTRFKDEIRGEVLREVVPQAIESAIAETAATSMKDLGTVMKAARANLEGKNIDGKALSEMVKAKLS